MVSPSGTGASVNLTYKITVHDFVAGSGVLTSRATSRLEQGRAVALACSSGRWVTPSSATDLSAFTIRHDRLYEYGPSPPHPMRGIQWPESGSIPEWGQPSLLGDADHFRLQDLQEFESTDLQVSALPTSRMRRSAMAAGDAFNHGKRVQDRDRSVDGPAKRPRLDLGCIIDLIPQPHFIPGPAAKFRPVDTRNIPPYQKSLPSPIAPYDLTSIKRLLSSAFRRSAWLIPVRGSLPWDGATMAVIAEAAQGASRSPSPNQGRPDNAITWTHESLQHFWAFLGSIQQAKHLGPLALSFHAATPEAISRDTASEPVWESNNPYYLTQSSKPTMVSSDTAFICQSHLEGTDYIKVYHDIPYSLSLRTILDAYQYIPSDGEGLGRSGANDRKIRILKGARLVLMDGHSKAAFLM